MEIFLFRQLLLYTSFFCIFQLMTPGAQVGRPLVVDVSFINPLATTLTDCKLMIEGPGVERTKVIQIRFL